MSSQPGDCGADAAAYVLGALDPSEADAFSRHLSTCAVCQDEVAAFRHVTDTLHLVASQRRAPRRLRGRLMRAVRAEPRAAAARARSGPRLRGAPARRLAPSVLAGIAVVLAVAALAVGGVELLSGGRARPTVIQARVIGSPGSAEVRLSGGSAELIVRNFAPPPAGDIYEVWLQRPGHPPSPTRALFSVTTGGAGDVGVPGDLHGVQRVLVTPEPAGGTLVPTHAPVIVAQLS